jgi:hypothetical protein
MIREFHAPQTKVLEGGTKDEIQMRRESAFHFLFRKTKSSFGMGNY